MKKRKMALLELSKETLRNLTLTGGEKQDCGAETIYASGCQYSDNSCIIPTKCGPSVP